MAIWRIRATVDDRPGYLSVLTASLALSSVNILSVWVHAASHWAVDDFLVDAPSTMTERALIEAVERGRGRDAWVIRSDARGLVDEPTRVLTLAVRVAAGESLADVLCDLLGPCEVTWLPGAPATREGCTSTDLYLADPAGGTVVVSRDEPVFTAAEYARAQTLAELAGVCVDLSYETGGWRRAAAGLDAA